MNTNGRDSPSEGIFITLEGGEGSGKSSLLPVLRERLLAAGISSVLAHEPGGRLEPLSPVCQELRRCLINKNYSIPMVPMTELLVFLAARAQNIAETIEPALTMGQWVLCDRFADSTLAYQGGARKLSKQVIEQLSQLSCAANEPDLTLLLDIDPAIGLARSKKSKLAFDRIESEALEFHQRVRDEYTLLARLKPERVVSLNAAQPLEQVADMAWQIIKTKFISHFGK